MKYSTKDIAIEFSLDGSFEPVTIYRNTTEEKREILGHVYQFWDESSETVTYQCVGIDGEEICPPTDEWNKAEQAFEKFVEKYLPTSLLEKQLEEMSDMYNKRINEATAIRDNKGRDTSKSIIR